MLKTKTQSMLLKNKSPLLLGVGEGFNVIASDALAMLQVTSEYKEIHDHEIVIVKKMKLLLKVQMETL